MHAPSPMALLLIAIVVLVLFGRGKVSSLMGEVGKGITAFKKGVKDGSEEDKAEPEKLESADDIVKARADLAAERAKLEADRARMTTDAGLRDVTPTDQNKL